MNTLKPEKRMAVLRSLVEGNSLRSTSRMTGVHKTTIMKILNEAGERCSRLMDAQMKDLPCQVIECDELWTFVQKKERNLSPDEKIKGKVGDQYIFVAIDPETKLVPVFAIGKRDRATTHVFVQEIRDRITGMPQITTDGFKPYVEAIEQAFGGEVHYATLVKNYEAENPGPGRYSPPSVKGVDITRISGKPERKRICTSYVERNNLTMRLSLKRLNRLTLAFSKKVDNLRAAIALHFAYYNFCRVHSSLRITPAMEAKITDRIWTLEEIAA
ncbi:MAG: DDE-type integrase/transposase/recombinase [Smithellaceae bacterium]|nr:DDE-type integrase/transposase/recombinase [Smithellaceae bacterium]